jgi:hypothetical protein
MYTTIINGQLKDLARYEQGILRLHGCVGFFLIRTLYQHTGDVVKPRSEFTGPFLISANIEMLHVTRDLQKTPDIQLSRRVPRSAE